MSYSSSKTKLSRKETTNRNNKLLKQLKQKKDGALDELINNEDKKAFKNIKCLECANCCKTTGPLFNNQDVARIAKHLKMKPGAFADQYLREDEDNDFVLKQVPCTFLNEDNSCSIYHIRPKACSDYPLTGMRGQKTMLPLLLKNSEICPAVETILEELMRNVLTHPKEQKMPD